jgi:hypothetical protein
MRSAAGYENSDDLLGIRANYYLDFYGMTLFLSRIPAFLPMFGTFDRTFGYINYYNFKTFAR